MLPRAIYSDIGSLAPGSPHFAISLSIYINKDGTVLYFHPKFGSSFDRTMVTNKAKLSYDLADRIIRDDRTSPQVQQILSDPERYNILQQALLDLQLVMKNRQTLRGTLQQTNQDDKDSISAQLVEETMLISHAVIPHYITAVKDGAEDYLKEYMEKEKIEKEERRRKQKEEKEKKAQAKKEAKEKRELA